MDLSQQERVGQIERVALTYIHYRVKSTAPGKLLYSIGSSAQHSDNLEGRGVRMGGYGEWEGGQEGGDI